MSTANNSLKSAHFINGAWEASSGSDWIDVIDPATEETFHRVPDGTAEDIDRAVAAARSAFDTGPWPQMSGPERAKVLRRMAQLIEARTAELAEIEIRDNGKPRPEAVWDIEDTAGVFGFYADLAETMDANAEEDIALPMDGFTSTVVKQPIGVAAAIIPWNFPMLMASWKVAPALAAGCTVVLKPSELTPLTALELGTIAQEAGLPAGALNIVTGAGAAGAALAAHPGADKTAFTGSVPTGRRVMQAAAEDIKAVSLELGGKSPFVIFADADMEEAVEWTLFGIFWNQGEVCTATSRVLVERPLYDVLLERLVDETRKITIGPGTEEVLMGALVSQGQYDKVQAAIATGVADGATLVTGGGRPAHLPKGYFMEPAIFADVPKDSTIWTEEIFGPVLCISPFDNEDDGVREANNSIYGLGAAVMSRDISRANRVARALKAGVVWVNCSQPTFTEVPWGGVKRSGIGRELGRWGLENYLETKQITSWAGEKPWGWYLK
ncbi:MAG: aldehyde dehydrogenase family protein [Hyphomonas sp.]|nr:aldehyde dehydrogenase family protein [Hyphomonas sp.]